CLGILRVPPRETALPIGRKTRPDLLGDGGADLLLQAEDAAGVAVAGVGPDLQLGAHENQPGGDPQMAALDAKRALYEIVAPEFPTDLRQRLRAAPVRHHRGTAGDRPTFGAHPAKRDDRVLGKTTGEIVGLRVAIEVVERQHPDRDACAWFRPPLPPPQEQPGQRRYGEGSQEKARARATSASTLADSRVRNRH